MSSGTVTIGVSARATSGMLVAERTIAEPMAARLKADWNEAYRGGELGKVALLSGGVTWRIGLDER